MQCSLVRSYTTHCFYALICIPYEKVRNRASRYTEIGHVKLATSLASVNIDRYKPKTEECTEPDGGGLYLQVFPSGAKSWQVQYKTQEGKGRRITVGNLPSHVV